MPNTAVMSGLLPWTATSSTNHRTSPNSYPLRPAIRRTSSAAHGILTGAGTVLRRTNGDGGGAMPAPGAGCFRIVEDKRRIFYDGQPLDLSRYEYEILKRFIQQPGRIYSRETLMSLVWDAPEMSMDRTVDAHIKNLRKKLKTVRDDLDPIVTHRSVGYSLREGL